MTGPNLYICVFIIAFTAMFPKDTIMFGAYLDAQIRLHTLNLRMWWMSYWMWRKLNRDMKKSFGMGMPPFKYVHLWDRDPLN